MTIPQSFTAGGLYWTVQMSDTLMEEHQKYGRTKFKAQVIELDSTISHALQMATFLHELMHVAVWNSGGGQSHQSLAERDDRGDTGQQSVQCHVPNNGRQWDACMRLDSPAIISHIQQGDFMLDDMLTFNDSPDIWVVTAVLEDSVEIRLLEH